MQSSLAQAFSGSSVEAAEPYARRVLFRGAESEVMLARWRAGRACAPHDHGGATGRVVILAGRFEEQTFCERAGMLEVTRRRVLGPGQVAHVDSSLIHAMRALNGGLTLHFYWPAIGSMRVFDLAKRETLRVSAECGAWVPRNLAQILAKTPWDESPT